MLALGLKNTSKMLVVRKYPEYFAGEKLWGPALVILPFLLLKIFLGGDKGKIYMDKTSKEVQ